MSWMSSQLPVKLISVDGLSCKNTTIDKPFDKQTRRLICCFETIHGALRSGHSKNEPAHQLLLLGRPEVLVLIIQHVCFTWASHMRRSGGVGNNKNHVSTLNIKEPLTCMAKVSWPENPRFVLGSDGELTTLGCFGTGVVAFCFLRSPGWLTIYHASKLWSVGAFSHRMFGMLILYIYMYMHTSEAKKTYAQRLGQNLYMLVFVRGLSLMIWLVILYLFCRLSWHMEVEFCMFKIPCFWILRSEFATFVPLSCKLCWLLEMSKAWALVSIAASVSDFILIGAMSWYHVPWRLYMPLIDHMLTSICLVGLGHSQHGSNLVYPKLIPMKLDDRSTHVSSFWVTIFLIIPIFDWMKLNKNMFQTPNQLRNQTFRSFLAPGRGSGCEAVPDQSEEILSLPFLEQPGHGWPLDIFGLLNIFMYNIYY